MQCRDTCWQLYVTSRPPCIYDVLIIDWALVDSLPRTMVSKFHCKYLADVLTDDISVSNKTQYHHGDVKSFVGESPSRTMIRQIFRTLSSNQLGYLPLAARDWYKTLSRS
jgi:hypothetical protein